MSIRNKKRGRIAFVYHPRYPKFAPLQSTAFAKNVLDCLTAEGWELDLYLWEDPDVAYEAGAEGRLVVIHVSEPPFRHIRLKTAWERHWASFAPKHFNYELVVGVGQRGCIDAAKLASRCNCPFIYLNDEFPSSFGKDELAVAEKKASKNCALFVIPDGCREGQLRMELGLRAEQPCVTMPNGPMQVPIMGNPERLLEQLGVKPSEKIALHAGTISDWSQIPELLSTLPLWPEDVPMVLHAKNRENLEYLTRLKHMTGRGRLIVSELTLDEPCLHAVLAASLCSFALYREIGINDRLMGFSSGKLCRSIVLGTPVIASRGIACEFVEKEELGCLVEHPLEIPVAINRIKANRERYSTNCKRFVSEKLNIKMYFQNLAAELKRVTSLDLFQTGIK